MSCIFVLIMPWAKQPETVAAQRFPASPSSAFSRRPLIMAERKLSNPGSIVKKSNALARAAWTVKSVYYRVWWPWSLHGSARMTKIFKTMSFQFVNCWEAADDGGKSYKLVAEVVDGLLGRVLTIPRPHGWAKCT